MQKKVLIIFMGVTGVALLAIGGFLFFRSEKEVITESPVSETSSSVVTPTPALKSLLWNDPAGFTFNYSESLKINSHPEDKINYSHLEITSPGKSGQILIMAQDTKFKNISEWEKGRAGLEATLGGKPARKINYPSGNVSVGVIDSAILFTIALEPAEDASFWQKPFEEITSSFAFWYPTPKPAANQSSTGSSDVIEEEEVIE